MFVSSYVLEGICVKQPRKGWWSLKEVNVTGFTHRVVREGDWNLKVEFDSTSANMEICIAKWPKRLLENPMGKSRMQGHNMVMDGEQGNKNS